MKTQDDRTYLEKGTHDTIIIALDTFMTGWGKAEGGRSYAGWACERKNVDKVRAWVENRTDTTRVRTKAGDYKQTGKGHCHIYVVDEGHPALN